MRLSAILERAGLDAGGAADAPVTGFAIDHRKVAPGTVFGAFQGASVNGEDFIPAAVESGAVAVVARPDAKVEGALHVADPMPRRAFARMAAQFFVPVPATIVAVTGTNGKTSTVEMTRQIWRMCGFSAASIGTLGVTTPDESPNFESFATAIASSTSEMEIIGASGPNDSSTIISASRGTLSITVGS
ncbi:MAG: hypothetical protein CL819_03630, partial [Croceicoccus sp.]|nr:hypothetical protein [Croceicoccus sp.]